MRHHRLTILPLLPLFFFTPPLQGYYGHGYHEWHDQLHNYQFEEQQFNDVVPIVPYEDPNTIYYDYSPYVDPEFNIENPNPS